MLPSRSRWSKRLTFSTSPSISKSSSCSRSISSSQCSTAAVERVEALDLGRRRQAVAAQLVEKLHVRRGPQPLDVAHAVAEEPQPPLGADPRVEQADAAGRDVARVGERRLALAAAALR